MKSFILNERGKQKSSKELIVFLISIMLPKKRRHLTVFLLQNYGTR